MENKTIQLKRKETVFSNLDAVKTYLNNVSFKSGEPVVCWYLDDEIEKSIIAIGNVFNEGDTEIGNYTLISTESSGKMDGLIGTPDDGDYTDGFFQWEPVTKIPNAFDDVNKIVMKLLPAKPEEFNINNVSLNNTYTNTNSLFLVSDNSTIDKKYISSTRNNYLQYKGFEAITPSSGFEIIPNKYFKVVVNNVVVAYYLFTEPLEPSRTYTNNTLTLITNDFQKDASSPSGIWVSVVFKNTILGSTDKITIDLGFSDSQTGTGFIKKNTYYFQYDVQGTSDITVSTMTAASNGLKNGVPTIRSTSGPISITGAVVELFNKVYQKNSVISVNLTGATSPITKNISSYSANESIALDTTFSSYKPNILSEDISCYIKTVDISNGTYIAKPSVLFSTVNGGKKCRMDTYPTLLNRYELSSNSEDEESISGSSFDHSTDLTDSFELQELGDEIVWPIADYSNLWVSGPNYSNLGVDSTFRYILLKLGTITSQSSFTLNIPGLKSLLENTNDVTIKLMITAVGNDQNQLLSKWLNGNKSFANLGNPGTGNCQDLYHGAVDMANSTIVNRKITLGSNILTGDVYMKLGLRKGANIRGINNNITMS